MDYFSQVCHSFEMGRKALKVDETSLACSRVFESVRTKREITMYRIKKDLTIANGRVDRLFKGETVWTLDDFAVFCLYFKVSPVAMIGQIEKEKDKAGKSLPPVSVLVPRVQKPSKPAIDTSRLVAQKSKKKMGSETDEGFDSA